MVKAQLLLVDDQELILEAISYLIKFRGAEQGIQVAGVARSYEQALIAIEQLQPNLVLLDMYMPKVNGHEIAAVLRKKWPKIKILMLSNHEDCTDIAQAKAAGANGYAFKSGSHQALINSIMAVLKGDRDFVVPSQFEGLASLDETPDMRLTHRQRQVLKLLAHGENNKSIAKLLKISARTVEKHREEVIGKLNNPSPIELVEFAQQMGLPLDPPT